MWDKPSHSWIIGCSTTRTRTPSPEVFTPFLKCRISTRPCRRLSCRSSNPSPSAPFPGLEELPTDPTHAVGHADLSRRKSTKHIKQPARALLHVLVLQRTASRAGANTPDALGRLTTPTYSQYWQPWSNRTSAGRLDLQKVQLSELEAPKSLPDVLPLYGFIPPYAHPVIIDLRDLPPLFFSL